MKIRDHLDDPTFLFSLKTEEMKKRIIILEKDLQKVNHYYSKAIIEKELEVLIDEFVARQLSLRSKEE